MTRVSRLLIIATLAVATTPFGGGHAAAAGGPCSFTGDMTESTGIITAHGSVGGCEPVATFITVSIDHPGDIGDYAAAPGIDEEATVVAPCVPGTHSYLAIVHVVLVDQPLPQLGQAGRVAGGTFTCP